MLYKEEAPSQVHPMLNLIKLIIWSKFQRQSFENRKQINVYQVKVEIGLKNNIHSGLQGKVIPTFQQNKKKMLQTQYLSNIGLIVLGKIFETRYVSSRHRHSLGKIPLHNASQKVSELWVMWFHARRTLYIFLYISEQNMWLLWQSQQGHNRNKLNSGILDNVTHQISAFSVLWFLKKKLFSRVCLNNLMLNIWPPWAGPIVCQYKSM